MMIRKTTVVALALLACAFGATKTRLAVNYFTVSGGVDPNLKSTMTILMESKLGDTGVFSMVDRANLDKVLQEQSLQSSGACSDTACQAKVGNILGVQKFVVGSVLKIGQKYKVVVKLLDVESASMDESVGSVEEYAGSEEDLEKAASRAARSIAERLPIYGVVKTFDDGEIIVDLGKNDRIIEGTEVEVRRAGSKIIDEKTGEVFEGKSKLLGSGTLVDVQPKISYLKLAKKGKDAPVVKVGDRIFVVVTDATKRKQADVYYKNAQVFFKNSSYEEAKSEIDKAINLIPDNAGYVSYRNQIEAKIESVNVAEIEKRARERRQNASSSSSSRSSSDSYRSSSRSSDGTLVVGVGAVALLPGNPIFLPTGTDFSKTFSQVGGLSATMGFPKSAFEMEFRYYFFANEANKSLMAKNALPTNFQSAQANIMDGHFRFVGGFRLFDFLSPRFGAGVFYRNFTTTFQDPAIGTAENKVDVSYWGLGAEVMAGLRFNLGGIGLDVSASYELVNISTFSLFDDSSTSSTKAAKIKALDALKGNEREQRLGIGGINLSASLFLRI